MSDYKFSRSQKGSTLIVVLIMLLLITIVGTWAIRGSMTSLNIATNTQAQVLLKQTSDAVFYQLENDTSDDVTLKNMQLGDGILAYLMRTENLGKELVFCLRGENENNWEGVRQGSMVYWEDTTTINNSELGVNGFCKVDKASDFISSRQASLTRVSMRVASTNKDFEHLEQGQNIGDDKDVGISTVIVNAISLLPSLSKASNGQISGCISNYTSYVDPNLENETVMDCLSEFNVPYSSQEMVYTLRVVKSD